MARTVFENLIINTHSSSCFSCRSAVQVFRKPSLVRCPAARSPACTSSNKQNLDEFPQRRIMTRKHQRQRAPAPLVKFSTSDGKWHDQWTVNYMFTLSELGLSDIAPKGEQDETVSVSLSIQKHAGFGFSIEGRVITSFATKCSNCFAPFRTEIDSNFDVWVLSSSSKGESKIPEIGASDPSVIYVKPGCEAHLDPLIQDTIRLSATTKDTCSKQCENATPRWQYTDGQVNRDQMWPSLSKLKESFRRK